MLKHNVFTESLDPSVTHWNDIVYYVPYCNVRTVARGIDSANK
ncbi:hypothetical protein [Wolbachia pipientis]